MKKIFKIWNIYEIILLVVSLVAVVLCFVFNKDKNVLSLVSSLVGVVYIMVLSKGLVSAQILNLIYVAFYVVVAFTQKLYGEMIVNIVLVLPLTIFTLVSWLKNRNSEDKSVITVSTISKKSAVVLTIVTWVIGIVFYLLLRALNTSQLIVSTIALALTVAASYLLLIRDEYYSLVYAAASIIRMVMWLTAGLEYLPLAVSFLVFIILDVYTFVVWKKMEKQQHENDAKSQKFH